MTYGAALCPVSKEQDTKALGFVGALLSDIHAVEESVYFMFKSPS